MKKKFFRMRCTVCGVSPWNKYQDHVEFCVRDHKLDSDHDVKIESGFVIV